MTDENMLTISHPGKRGPEDICRFFILGCRYKIECWFWDGEPQYGFEITPDKNNLYGATAFCMGKKEGCHRFSITASPFGMTEETIDDSIKALTDLKQFIHELMKIDFDSFDALYAWWEKDGIDRKEEKDKKEGKSGK